MYFQKKLLFEGLIDFNGDTLRMYYPSWVIGKNLLSQGFYFLWDPYRCMGQPFLAAPTNEALYPLRFISVFVGYLDYQRLSVIFHILLSSVFGYFLIKDYFSSEAAAVLGALGLGFNGFFIANISYSADFAALAWVPAALYFLRKRRAFLLGMVLTLQLLAGYTPLSIITVLLLVPFAWIEKNPTVALKGVAWMAGLSAFQLLPFAELLKESGRSLLLNPTLLTEHSIAPKAILHHFLFASGVFGNAPTAVPLLEDFYMGPIFLLLFVWGCLRSCADAKKLAALALCGVGFLALSFGKWLPGYSFIPGVQFFKFPSQWAYPFMVILVLVAAYGLQAIKSNAVRFAIIFLAAIDLCGHYHRVDRIRVKEDFFTETKTRLTELMKPMASTRIFHVPQIINNSVAWSNAGGNWVVLKGIMTPSSGVTFGFKEAASHHNLTTRRHMDYVSRMMAAGETSPLFDYAGIRTIVTLTKEGQFKPLPDQDDFGTIINPDPKPRVFFTGGGTVEEIVADKPGRISLTAQGPGELVVSESFYPGWRLRVDGAARDVEIFEKNFLKTTLESGRHQIEFTYFPASFLLGLFISLSTVVLVLFLQMRRRFSV